MRTVTWNPADTALEMIDQRRLPAAFEIVSYRSHQQVARAITEMVVRGAPAIGAAAAFGLVLAGCESQARSTRHLLADLQAAADTLKSARPTAVNLAWAVDRLMRTATSSDVATVDQLH
jgi:methylthioribose-1-phosphate isomerase